MSSCKEICNDGVNKSYHITYKNGYKFCRTCNKYFLQESYICKCCKTRLRGKPANGIRREILVSESRLDTKKEDIEELYNTIRLWEAKVGVKILETF